MVVAVVVVVSVSREERGGCMFAPSPHPTARAKKKTEKRGGARDESDSSVAACFRQRASAVVEYVVRVLEERCEETETEMDVGARNTAERLLPDLANIALVAGGVRNAARLDGNVYMPLSMARALQRVSEATEYELRLIADKTWAGKFVEPLWVDAGATPAEHTAAFQRASGQNISDLTEPLCSFIGRLLQYPCARRVERPRVLMCLYAQVKRRRALRVVRRRRMRTRSRTTFHEPLLAAFFCPPNGDQDGGGCDLPALFAAMREKWEKPAISRLTGIRFVLGKYAYTFVDFCVRVQAHAN